MVRTAATAVRLSGGGSSKKSKGGGGSSSATSSRSKSSASSSRLPPIPHQETPSWQKPITNFFVTNNKQKVQNVIFEEGSSSKDSKIEDDIIKRENEEQKENEDVKNTDSPT